MSKVAQAGAIAYRVDGAAPRVLIVRAKKTPEEWIFPKGHIENGETAAAAAVRELEEEAGIRGEVLDMIGTLEFESGDEFVKCDYFLIKSLGEVPREEDREKRWCEYEEAKQLLTHPDAIGLLDKAIGRLNG